METEYVERILDYRRQTASVREMQQDALLASMYDLDAALGRMISFSNLNTDAFPVDCHEVSISSEVDVLADYGMQVIALRDGDKASRVYANIYTRDIEEQMSLTPHSPKALSKYKWLLETQNRSADGSITDTKARFESADCALTAVKARLLKVATEVISKGHYDVAEDLPDGDVDAGIAIHKHMEYAAKEGVRVRKLAAELRDVRLRVSSHIVGLYTNNISEIGFLKNLGFSLEIEGERSIISTRIPGGLDVSINHGEGYRSTIRVQAVDTDPTIISFSISDNEGRKELRSQVHANDDAAIVSEIRGMIMAEIEDAEAAWLPALEQLHDESLSRSMIM